MSLQAYQRAAQRTETPKETELRLLTQVTRALTEAAASDPTEFGKRAEALDWNRRVWEALGSDCAGEGNALPEELRAQLISLSIFIVKQTAAIMRREDDDWQILIDLNRAIMQGLSGPSEPRAAA
jgi:flagellar protein FlaF